MTNLTKIFIVILGVFSIAFSILAIQYTAHTANFRALAEANRLWAEREQELRNASENQLSIVQTHLNQIIKDQQNQLAQQGEKLDKASADLAGESNKLLAQTQMGASLEGEKTQLMAMLAAADAERKQLQGQLAETRKQLAGLQTENFKLAKLNQELDLQRQLYEQKIRLLTEQNRSLEEMADKLQARLSAYSAGGQAPRPREVGGGKVAMVAEPQAAPIMGQITEVRDSLAGISIGVAQGVQQGMEFIVYRGSQYLGKLKVTQVLPDQAAGELLQVQGTIRPGDSVADKFQF